MSVNRKRVATDRSRERREHESDRLADLATRAGATPQSAGFADISLRPRYGGGGGGDGAALHPALHYEAPDAASSTSPPRDEDSPTAHHFQQRSPLQYHGDHISFLPPHVIESLRPYYTKAADALPRVDEDGRPRPPPFIFAPRYLDSSTVPNDYSVAGPVDPADLAARKARMTSAAAAGQSIMSSAYAPSASRGGGGGSAGGGVASSTQTVFDVNAPVSFVDVSASNAVLQRRVERLQQTLDESLAQREKLGEVVKAMSYAIVPPLAFLPHEFYMRNRSVIDTCSDYAVLYRSALRATPSVGDIHAMDMRIQEQSKEHLMDRVVMLTSEVMRLNRLVADMQKSQQMSA